MIALPIGRLRAAPLAAFVLLCAACASQPSAVPRAGERTAPPPPVNLSGYPPEYRQGHADGCSSVRGPLRRDAGRYEREANYRMGWDDGRAVCAKMRR